MTAAAAAAAAAASNAPSSPSKSSSSASSSASTPRRSYHLRNNDPSGADDSALAFHPTEGRVQRLNAAVSALLALSEADVRVRAGGVKLVLVNDVLDRSSGVLVARPVVSLAMTVFDLRSQLRHDGRMETPLTTVPAPAAAAAAGAGQVLKPAAGAVGRLRVGKRCALRWCCRGGGTSFFVVGSHLGSVTSSLRISVRGDYRNHRLGCWEPFLESWEPRPQCVATFRR